MTEKTEEVNIKEEKPALPGIVIAASTSVQDSTDSQNSGKRKNCYTSDDEEGFAGFDKNDINNDGYMKKFKTDSSSESEQTTPSKKIILRSDPAYLVPLVKYGWKRELVLRAEPVMSKEKGEVYYITPSGKKLRTRHEIQNNLHDDLTINNFTLVKEALGAPPEYEIIRNAKFYNFARRSVPEVTTPEPLPVLGKRTPKPKLPKGASPPPPSIPRAVPTPKTATAKSQPASKQTNKFSKENYESSMGGSSSKAQQNKSSKAKGGCSIQCLAAMGKIPQIQCKLCMNIYHPECIQITPIGHGLFACEVCTSNKSHPAPSSIQKAQEPVSRKHHPTNQQPQIQQQPQLQQPANILASVNSNAPPKCHNFTKNPQTIVSCKNNKFIVFETSSPADDEMQLNSLRKKLYEDLSKNVNNVKPAVKTLVEPPVARPALVKATNKSPVAANANKLQVQPSSTVSPFNFSVNFCHNVAFGYNVLLQTFQYLKVQELQRASCVCRMWNHLANHRSLWRTVRMKNSHVNDWKGFVKTLKRNDTKHLDLRKMLMGNQEESWREFSAEIGNCVELESIDLCRCHSHIVETLMKTNPSLKVINAVSLKDEKIDLSGLADLQYLEELRLRTNHANGMVIELKRENDPEPLTFSDLRHFKNLKHLSLTSVQNLYLLLNETNRLQNCKSLESLELGYLEFCDHNMIAANLLHLQNLKRLRLEKGSSNFNVNEILQKISSSLPNIEQLELINCDIKIGFDDVLKGCTHLKKLLLIPTYVSQSAATNYMVLRGVMNLGNHLDMFVWVVTSELLRVTELYVDQCDTKGEKSTKRSPDKSICSPMKISDCIPILKPVPGLDIDNSKESTPSADNIQKIEIVNLKTVENILSKSLTKSKFKLLKISHVNTWKQTMLDL